MSKVFIGATRKARTGSGGPGNGSGVGPNSAVGRRVAVWLGCGVGVGEESDGLVVAVGDGELVADSVDGERTRGGVSVAPAGVEV